MIKITLAQLKESKEPLERLIAQPMHVIPSYKLGKQINFINKELNSFEAKRIQLIKQYAGKPDKKGNISVTPANEPKFFKDIESLLKLEIELPGEQLVLSELPDVILSASDCMSLDWLFMDNSKDGKKPQLNHGLQHR